MPFFKRNASRSKNPTVPFLFGSSCSKHESNDDGGEGLLECRKVSKESSDNIRLESVWVKRRRVRAEKI